MTKLNARKAALTRRMDELVRRLNGIETELDAQRPADWEDAAQEREGDEVLEQLGLSGQEEVRMIQAALDRIDAGAFGICARCGEDISEERLDVLPFTPICRNCASRVAG